MSLSRQWLEQLNADPSFEDLQPMLVEQYSTQMALDELRFDQSKSLSTLPKVNEVLLSQEKVVASNTEWTETVEVQVMGMPNAGKTSMIEKFIETHNGVISTEERNKEARDWLRELGLLESKYSYIQVYQAGKRSQQVLDILNDEETLKDHPVIVMDRGIVDIGVFDRAYFLEGRMPNGDFEIYAPFHFLEFTEVGTSMGKQCFINCLVPPKKSLDRQEPWEKPGSVMNTRFLTTLYEQYLRFHHEALIHKQSPYFSYACLDMTGDDYQYNQKLFDETLEKVINHFIK